MTYGRYARIGMLVLALPALLWLADRFDPPPLGRIEAPGSTLVLASDGTPLRAFADRNGVWRYRTTQSEVSQAYLCLLYTSDAADE